MRTGEKIRYYRKLKNLTQKELGMLCGFNEKSADVRIRQYESNKMVPKEDIMNKIAYALNVSVFQLRGIKIDNEEMAEEIIRDLVSEFGLELVGSLVEKFKMKMEKKKEN